MTIKARLMQMLGPKSQQASQEKQLQLLLDSIDDVPDELEELRDTHALNVDDVKRILEGLENTVSECIEILTEKNAGPEIRAEIRKFRNRLRQKQR